MNAFLLYIVVLSQLCVDPLKAGGVPGDDVVVIDVTGFGNDAEEGAELSSA